MVSPESRNTRVPWPFPGRMGDALRRVAHSSGLVSLAVGLAAIFARRRVGSTPSVVAADRALDRSDHAHRAPLHRSDETGEMGFDLSELLDGIADEARARCRARGLGFERRIASNLPRWVVGDAALLKRALDRLVDDAIRCTERGSISLTAEPVTQDALGETVEFGVEDMSGDRTASSPLPQIGSPGADGAYAASPADTLRLERAIANELVLGMGGTLRRTRRPEVGVRFHFALPLGATDASKPEEIDHARPCPVSALLAEDNDVNALIVTKLLESFGCRVTRVTTGADALSRIQDADFDIVFFDWRMPEMDGLEALRRLRRIERHARLPIVVVTANALEEDRAACFAAGASGYLTKPVRPAELRRALEELVPEHSLPTHDAGT